MADPYDQAFLGVGWAFPPQAAAPAGEVETVAYEDDIRQAIWIILGTAPGERVMRPRFGAGLRTLMFEPLNTTTMALAQHRVHEALITWEPRIDSITVTVTAEPEAARLNIEVRYRVRATNTFYNLVYPFYVLEGEAR